MAEEINSFSYNKQSGFTPRELIFKYLRYLPWVIISVAIMGILAYLKLRYSTPIYSVSGKILVKKNNNPYANSSEKFDDIFMMQGTSNNLNDEIEIIKSRSMAARVIRSLGLQTSYYSVGKIRGISIIHQSDVPFSLELQLVDSVGGFQLPITVVNDNDYKIGAQAKLYHFGDLVTLSNGRFRLSLNGKNRSIFNSNTFIINWTSEEAAAANLSAGIKVAQATDVPTNVLLVSYSTENVKQGLDVVNQFMEEYRNASLEDKRQIAANTLNFIEDQLKNAKGELGRVERDLQDTRERNRVFAPEQQSLLYFGELSESSKQITDQGVKLKIVDGLIKYIANTKNYNELVPTTLGISEPSLVQQITDFNKIQMERLVSMKTTPAASPFMKNLDLAAEKTRNDMLENLNNIRNTYVIALNDLNRKSDEANNQLKTIPGKEKQLLEVARQQKILEELYSYLLQKKLETSISSASTISNIKVLETAMGSGAPISPNRKGLYTIYIFIGILIPVGIVFLLEFLNDKVKSKVDIERLTDAPVLGEIGHAEDSGALVVKQNNRQYIAEQFRIIRSNLQYILPKQDKPVMMVTSSFSGEGKSFISTNLGAVLAISGKRTVILEFDIRKPKIMEGLGLHERKGITNFIVGNISISEIIYPVPGQENLYVIPCGPVPPNPSEMLLDEKVKILFAQLKDQFDVVIVDTAPVGLVSDAITLGQHSNAAMYIVRHNYTYKKQIQLIDDLYTSNKLPHLAIIINDIKIKGGYGGYYGYGNYGYGYGYGYTSGYFENQPVSPKRRFHRLRKWIKRVIG